MSVRLYGELPKRKQNIRLKNAGRAVSARKVKIASDTVAHELGSIFKKTFIVLGNKG